MISLQANPLVSVIMPVFNGIGTVEKSIKSLMLQTYTHWECIVVNDGSTDSTKQYLDSLNDKRFIVHHFPENRGRPYARQKALDLAKGKYLAMLDADDWYLPEKLEFQVGIMEGRPDLALLTGACLLLNKKQNPIAVSGPVVAKEHFGYYRGINHGSSMIRMKEAKQVRFNLRLFFGEDLDFIERILGEHKFCLAVPDIHYIYNVGVSFSLLKYWKAQWLNYTKDILNLVPLMKIIYISVLFFFGGGQDAVLRKRGRPPSESARELYKFVKANLSMK